MEYLADRQRRKPSMVCMTKVMAFAIFSTRRLSEISRIKWKHLDSSGIIVENLKHPTLSRNHVRLELTPEAMDIIHSMPRTHEEIFPFTPAAIAANFQRARNWLFIEDLSFHDLRHEGISRLFELGHDVPYVASVSGHLQWSMLARYTHLKGRGDKYANAPWREAVGIKKSPEQAGDENKQDTQYITGMRPTPFQAGEYTA